MQTPRRKIRPHTKSRDGCIRCRSRHVRCDKAKPECQTCRIRYGKCSGYEPPKTWLFEPKLKPTKSKSSLDSPQDDHDAAQEQDLHSYVEDGMKQRRKWAPKTRTGCTTCRGRRIKCDEQKPRCMRCTRSGLQCGGYRQIFQSLPLRPHSSGHDTLGQQSMVKQSDLTRAISDRTRQDFVIEDFQNLNINPTVPSNPSGPYKHQHEQLALRFWLERTRFWSGFLPGSQNSNLLGFVVPYVAWDNSTIRNCMMAAAMVTASLDTPGTESGAFGLLPVRALAYGNCAIQDLINRTMPLHVVVLAAFLFYFIEGWQGNLSNAMLHLASALRIVREAKKDASIDPILCEYIEAVYNCTPRPFKDDSALTSCTSGHDLDRESSRLAYTLAHFQNTIFWLDDAVETARQSPRRDSCAVLAILEVHKAEIQWLYNQWQSNKNSTSLKLPPDLSRLESPYSDVFESFKAFKTDSSHFKVRDFEFQMKQTLRSTMLFTAGSNLVMRKEAATTIRIGNALCQQIISSHSTVLHNVDVADQSLNDNRAPPV